ncbi:MAG: hypothetical protein NC090_02615 [Anaeroplasma bactoclasticum]|nr:hypothetical protein [Anaeroplasma bactoclasticum]
MKKIIVLFLGLISILTLSGCSCSNLQNKYIVKENGIDITIPKIYQDYLLYSTPLPMIHFDYDGVRISNYSTDNKIVFVQNDQYILSDAFKNHLETYQKDQIIVTSSVEQQKDTLQARVGKDRLVLDEGTISKEEMIIVTLEDGTRISYSYRTFVSGGKTYYVYRYVENMMIYMHMPFMVVKKNNENKLVLLPLPYDTKYIVSDNIELDKLIGKNVKDQNVDKYVDTEAKEGYYIFYYPDYIKKQTTVLEEQIEKTKEWYITHCNGRTEKGMFLFDYLGNTFSIDFNVTKLGLNESTNRNEQLPAFQISYIG